MSGESCNAIANGKPCDLATSVVPADVKNGILQFGARTILGTPTARFLFTGNGPVAPTFSLHLVTPYAGTLQNLTVTQDLPAGAGAQTLTYEVLVTDAPTGIRAILLVTAGSGGDFTNTFAVGQGATVSITVIKSAAHALVRLVNAAIQLV